ncbi:MAG: Endopolyphosphatase [Vezdaea aestivalis]|nr:MAG: Endopolyphosphatase [Vezdaea aestivalis]
MQLFPVLIFAGLVGWSGANPTSQTNLLPPNAEPLSKKGRKLQGRFLHITDFHPDPFYKLHSSTEREGACHRGSGPAGTYGAETSACDSPLSLVDATFDWIEANIKDSIDFVIWTGDSARHDNDEKIPRSRKQVLELNRMMSDKFVSVFGNKDDPTQPLAVPVIPTFGNNDVLPHNILSPGPNFFTRQYLDIWRYFIPEEQRHTFVQGGWFFVEAIPNKLAVFSINTLYFFDANSAVDGCADASEPGYWHMDWLRVQLQIMRERGMKAILTGHVPPARAGPKMSWDETCWQKYTLWLQQYRDVVVSSVYGHMNVDHFFMQDSHDLNLRKMLRDVINVDTPVGEIVLDSAENYLQELQHLWSEIPDPPIVATDAPSFRAIRTKVSQAVLRLNPWNDKDNSAASKKSKEKWKNWKHRTQQDFYRKIGGPWAERYSLSLVSPSIVPNYYPTLRIVEYNITGIEDSVVTSIQPSGHSDATIVDEIRENSTTSPPLEPELDLLKKKKKKKHHKKKKKHPKHPRFIVPDPPSKSAPPGPAYSPQPLTWISYTQYYANLTFINNDLYDAENVSTSSDFLPFDTSYSVPSNQTANPQSLIPSRWHDGKHVHKRPHKKHPHPRPLNFAFEVEYNTSDPNDVFALQDLTVRSFVELARRIGRYRPSFLMANRLDEQRLEAVENVVDVLDSDDNEDGEVQADGKGKKHRKHKKHKKRKKQRKDAIEAWFSFTGRALVSTRSREELEEVFG